MQSVSEISHVGFGIERGGRLDLAVAQQRLDQPQVAGGAQGTLARGVCLRPCIRVSTPALPVLLG